MGDKKKHVIRAGQVEANYWRDLWSYRELFYFLAWRDVTVRYKQTAIGIVWALIRPFLIMIVMTVIFGKLAKLPSQGVPYPILVFAALLPWQFFTSALSECGNSLVYDANLISKVYFPRLVIPISSVIVGFVDFLISVIFLVAILLWYQFVPNWGVLLLPIFILIAFATALGAGLWLATLNVKYRDFSLIIPFVAQFGLYLSPVGFSSNIIPENWRLLYSLNPMVGVIDGFRWAILGGENHIYWPGLALSAVLSYALLASGVWYFRKTERTFADII